MNKDVDCSQIITEKVLDLSLDITDNSVIGLSCENIHHEENNHIREGNRAYLIIIREDDEMELESTICKRCNVKDSFERIQSEYEDVAVVEATVDVDVEDDRITFYNPRVWEII